MTWTALQAKDQVLRQDLPSHPVSPQNPYIFWKSPGMRRDLTCFGTRKKKFVSAPWTNRVSQCGFSAFY